MLKEYETVHKMLVDRGLKSKNELFQIINKQSGTVALVPGDCITLYLNGRIYDWAYVGKNTTETVQKWEKLREKEQNKAVKAATEIKVLSLEDEAPQPVEEEEAAVESSEFDIDSFNKMVTRDALEAVEGIEDEAALAILASEARLAPVRRLAAEKLA